MKDHEQFLEVVDRGEAERRFWEALSPRPLGEELVDVGGALGRVASRDVFAPVDVPSFDRSNFDGYALQASDTFGADEERPRVLMLVDAAITPGVHPTTEIHSGQAVGISTGGMLPRGADAVLMVEHAEVAGQSLLVRRAIPAGFGVTFAGTDISAGELVVRRGELLTSRETGVLAAVGLSQVWVWRHPRVAIISTGDELRPPGAPMTPGAIYDSNSRMLADAVRELGCTPLELGIVADNPVELERTLAKAIATCDAVLLSGGTSKGEGDICYRVVYKLNDPGVVVHGVALKPGKPLCLAVTKGKPVVVLPGFPTSALFTFHEFVAPVLRRMAGRPPQQRSTVTARLAVRINSEIGRTEYVLVGLVRRQTQLGEEELLAYPMGKGSGSVTAFSRADGFVTVERHEEILDAGAVVPVTLLARDLAPADLVVIGSHCLGLDMLLSELQSQGIRCKFLAVGSTAGFEAARRGECDLAGVHLLDPVTGQYNRPFLSDDLELIPGYGRLQGFVYRTDDHRFDGLTAVEAVERALADTSCVMVNRNVGSGTRVLIDQLLAGRRPRGYAVQARNHTGVAAAVAQRRADWGIAILPAARQYGLRFLPLREEQFDFVVPRSRMERPAIKQFCQLLESATFRDMLVQLGLIQQPVPTP